MKINNITANYATCTFLGGTCATSTWRSELIPMLSDKVMYFDPQVADWSPADAEKEDACKPVALYQVFVITGDSLSTYSGYEICEESSRMAEKGLADHFIFATVGELPENQQKGMAKITKALAKKGCIVCESLEEIANILNTAY